ncbi:DUF1804 family protein [Hydrogenimonas thermophila]|uniref:DUF1804 family protein n=1 Tax=Hydrogenimonas thermophila TaxID=223786 RepID=UPI0029370B00|nr:DUF1804 family protein [Hydrogenimonas thermophila]WOE69100.1 DUF1804 family protein [Hydrogenimonas thermophila]WOE71610.1 DUF1804 family protein [Hydrogenimonas thermophila]
MTKEQKRAVAKALYLSGKSLDEIAKILGVSKRTVQNYKSKEWDEEKTKELLQKGDEKLYTNFLEYMHAFLKEIKDSSLKPDVKAEKIAQIGDSFAKMRKIAAMEDPEEYTLGVVKHTLKTLLKAAAKELGSECMETLLEVIDKTSEELSSVAI